MTEQLLVVIGLFFQLIGALCLIGRPSIKYFKAYILRNSSLKKKIEDEAIGTTFNRLASDDRQKNLSDSIARGFITTYKNTFYGLLFILIGFLCQAGAVLNLKLPLQDISTLMFILIGAIVILIVMFFRFLINKDNSSWQALILIVSLIAIVVSIHIANQTIALTKKQISLQLRPFLAVIGEPIAQYTMNEEGSRNWLTMKHHLKNYGEQPAHNFKRKNDAFIKMVYPSHLIEDFKKVRENPEANDTQIHKALFALINWRKDIMKDIYDYLFENPLASQSDINNKFSEYGATFCYGDISDFVKPETVIVPNQLYESSTRRDVGDHRGKDFIHGKEAVMHYLYLTYEGSVTGKEYKTLYICYYDAYEAESNKVKIEESKVKINFAEYKQWIDRESL